MPRTKLQGVVFGILMSITMAIGMEVYNVAVKMGLQCHAWRDEQYDRYGDYTGIYGSVLYVAVCLSVL